MACSVWGLTRERSTVCWSVRRDDLSENPRHEWTWALGWIPGGICILCGGMDKGPPVLRPSGLQVESLGRKKKKAKNNKPTKKPKNNKKRNTTKPKLLFLLLLFCGFSKRGLRTAREDEGTADGCKVDPTIQSVYTAEDTFFSSAPSSEAAGCIDSICSGKWCNCFTSSAKINVCISSEQTHKWGAAPQSILLDGTGTEHIWLWNDWLS